MQLRPSLRVLAVTVGIAFAGCGSNLAPVLQIESGSALGYGNAPLPAEQVQQIVYAALLAKRWNIDSSAPGYFIATTRAGEFYATVRIDCGPGAYAIHYVGSSPNLRFDGSRIHRRYNHWVDRLDHAIRRELQRAGTTGVVFGGTTSVVLVGTPPPAAVAPTEPVKPPGAP